MSPQATAGLRPTRCGRSLRARGTTRRCRPAPSVRDTRGAGSSRAAIVERGGRREAHVAVVRHRDDLLRAVAGIAVVPDHRLEYEHHAGLQNRTTRRTRRRDRCRRTASPRCRCRSRGRGRSTKATAAGRRRGGRPPPGRRRSRPVSRAPTRGRRPPARGRTGRVAARSVLARRSRSPRSRRRSRAG